MAHRFINEINYQDNYVNLFETSPLVDFHTSIRTISRMYNQSIFEHSETEGSLVNLLLDLKKSQVIIDIDSYNNQIQHSNDINKIVSILENLRNRKNSIFFQIVSEKLEEVL